MSVAKKTSAAKKANDPPPHRGCVLHELPDGTLVAHWPTYMIRFLLSDGRTVDVATYRDDSDLRGALLDYTKVERIEGSTRLTVPPDVSD